MPWEEPGSVIHESLPGFPSGASFRDGPAFLSTPSPDAQWGGALFTFTHYSFQRKPVAWSCTGR